MHRKQRKRVAQEASDQYQEVDSKEDNLTSTKKPKFYEEESKEWNTEIETSIKVLKVTFDFGPLELNTYQYVFDGLKYIWKLPGLSTELIEPDDSFILITDLEEDVEELCLDLFSSLPTCTEIPITDLEKDFLRLQPLLVCLKHGYYEQKDILSFLTTLRPDDSHAFFVLEENMSKETLKRVGLKTRNDVIIHRAKGATRAFYDLCYKILLKKISEYTAVLTRKPNTRGNSHCLKLLHNYGISIKDTAKPSHLKDAVVKQVDKAVKETSPEYHIIGYALHEKVLKIFAGSEIESRVSDLVNKVRSLVNKSFKGRVIAQLLTKPYIVPFTALKGGCMMRAVQVERTGTLGMFAKCLNGDQSRPIGISSGHVAIKGNDIQVEIAEEKMPVGKCIWPETSVNNANIKDISVITLNSDIAESIDYRMPKFNVKLRTVDLAILNHRKVFKIGAKTDQTFGHLKCAEKLKLKDAEAMFIEAMQGETRFSEAGDSGAIVFTQIGRDLIAVGVVFGSDLTLKKTPEQGDGHSSDVKEAHCIAVDLKNAIGFFESSGKGIIALEKI